MVGPAWSPVDRWKFAGGSNSLCQDPGRDPETGTEVYAFRCGPPWSLSRQFPKDFRE